MFHRVIGAALAFALAPAIATAQDAPASAQEIAEARAYADALIADADAGAYFQNVTTDAVPTVRHKASGLTCAFSDERYDRIVVYPADPKLALGENVGCNTRLLDVDFSSYATRYAQTFDERFILEDAARAIVNRWPDARPHADTLVSASADDGPAPLVAGYDVTINGRPSLTLVFVSHQDDWSFKGRATGAGQEASAHTNLMGAMMFLMSLPGSSD